MNAISPLRVVFCLHDSPTSLGGPYVWAQRLLPCLHQEDIELTALIFTPGGLAERCTTSQILLEAGIACRFCDFDLPIQDRIRWVLEQCGSLQPQVVVANFQIEVWYASRWLRKAGIPVVGVLHSDDDFYEALMNLSVFEQNQWRLSGVVAVSAYLAGKVQARNAKIPVWRIPCGVPIPALRTTWPGTGLRIAYVGRLIEYQKRVSTVAAAFCRLTQTMQDVECLIIGEGPERAAIEALIAEQGAGERVHVMGKVEAEQIPDLLATCHVITLLSDYEGVPIALMEAMALGLVPVCLNIRSGIPELVEPEETGLLVEDREASFDAAIRRLREDPALWQRLSGNSRELIRSSYSQDVTLRQWSRCLHEAAATSPPPARPSASLTPRLLRLPPPDPALHWGDRRPQPWRRTWRRHLRLRFRLGMLRQRLLRSASGKNRGQEREP